MYRLFEDAADRVVFVLCTRVLQFVHTKRGRSTGRRSGFWGRAREKNRRRRRALSAPSPVAAKRTKKKKKKKKVREKRKQKRQTRGAKTRLPDHRCTPFGRAEVRFCRTRRAIFRPSA